MFTRNQLLYFYKFITHIIRQAAVSASIEQIQLLGVCVDPCAVWQAQVESTDARQPVGTGPDHSDERKQVMRLRNSELSWRLLVDVGEPQAIGGEYITDLARVCMVFYLLLESSDHAELGQFLKTLAWEAAVLPDGVVLRMNCTYQIRPVGEAL